MLFYRTLGEMKLTRMLTKETSNISTGGNKFFPLAGQKQNSRISPLRDCKEFFSINRKRKCEKKKKKKKKEEEEKTKVRKKKGNMRLCSISVDAWSLERGHACLIHDAQQTISAYY